MVRRRQRERSVWEVVLPDADKIVAGRVAPY